MNVNRDDILTAAANGNAAALEFLRVFARRAHFIDDCCDDPPRKGVGEMADAEAEWLVCLASNPFFLAHRAQLVPSMLLAMNAWADSEMPKFEWRSQRDVIKGQWHEVVWLVAWLTGGWDHLKAMSREFREYDFEPVKEPESGANGREVHHGTLR